MLIEHYLNNKQPMRARKISRLVYKNILAFSVYIGLTLRKSNGNIVAQNCNMANLDVEKHNCVEDTYEK